MVASLGVVHVRPVRRGRRLMRLRGGGCFGSKSADGADARAEREHLDESEPEDMPSSSFDKKPPGGCHAMFADGSGSHTNITKRGKSAYARMSVATKQATQHLFASAENEVLSSNTNARRRAVTPLHMFGVFTSHVTLICVACYPHLRCWHSQRPIRRVDPSAVD